MSISLVQVNNADNTSSVSLVSNVTAGNSVILCCSAYNSSGTAMDCTNPQYAGNSVPGAVKLIDQNTTLNGYQAYGAVWLLPNLAGGATGPFSVTFSNQGGVTEYQAFEISGLGIAPVAGPSAANSGTGNTPASGNMSALTGEAFVIGFGVANNNVFSNPPASAPWTPYYIDAGYDCSGYQVASSGTYAWTPSMGSSAQWAAMATAVYETAPTSSTAIAFAGSNCNTNDGPTEVVVPGTVNPGDIVLIFTSTFSPGNPASVTTSGTTTPVKVDEVLSGAGPESYALWQFRATGGDAGATLSFSTPTSTWFQASLVAYSGASPISTSDWLGGNNGGGSSEPWTAPEVTSQAASCWGVYFAIDESDSPVTYPGAIVRNLDPTSGAGAYDSGGSIGPAGTVVGGGGWSSSEAGWWIGYTIALRPAPYNSGLLMASFP